MTAMLSSSAMATGVLLALLACMQVSCVNGQVNTTIGADKKPHILFIVADDLGFGDLGYTGSSIKTPNIDTLAGEGTVMGHYYVMHCCSPTRSALHTGRYNIRYGLQTGVIPNNKEYGLNLTETLLPQYMNRLGYESHAIGKWHLGLYQWDYTPTYRGYKSFYGYYGGSEDYYTHKNSGMDFHFDNGPNCGPNCSVALLNEAGNYSTPLYAQRATQVISQHDADTPLFLYLAFQAVHCPIEAPESYVKPYEHLDPNRRVFAGMLAALDEAVGDVVQALNSKNMLNDTLIVFTTDNGGPVGSKGGHPSGIGCATGAQNYPLRGGKGAYYQGGVRGTSFVWGNLVHESLRGQTNYALAHVTDWLPTLVEAGGGGGPSWKWDKPLDGVSQFGVLNRGQPSAREHVLINIERDHPTTAPCVGCSASKPTCNGVGQYAAIQDRYKILVGGGGLPNIWYHDDHPYNGSHPTPTDECLTACVPAGTGGCLSVPDIQVFDVIHDPSEVNDLSSNTTLVRELMGLVHMYNSTEYHEALTVITPVENKCPFNDHRGVLTPCS